MRPGGVPRRASGHSGRQSVSHGRRIHHVTQKLQRSAGMSRAAAAAVVAVVDDLVLSYTGPVLDKLDQGFAGIKHDLETTNQKMEQGFAIAKQELSSAKQELTSTNQKVQQCAIGILVLGVFLIFKVPSLDPLALLTWLAGMMP